MKVECLKTKYLKTKTNPSEIEIVGFIEITRPKVYEEAAFFEQRIPDNIQKIDALNDFISSIDTSLQKDPKALRAIRILVETLFYLKQSTIAYNDDGSVRGQKDISASTLSELINKVPVPLGRPILDVKKKLYGTNEDVVYTDEIKDDIYFENFAEASVFKDSSRAIRSKTSSRSSFSERI